MFIRNCVVCIPVDVNVFIYIKYLEETLEEDMIHVTFRILFPLVPDIWLIFITFLITSM